MVQQNTHGWLKNTAETIQMSMQPKHRTTTAKAAVYAGLSLCSFALAIANICIIKDGFSQQETTFVYTGFDQEKQNCSSMLTKKNLLLASCAALTSCSIISTYYFFNTSRKTIKKNLIVSEFIDNNQLK